MTARSNDSALANDSAPGEVDPAAAAAVARKVKDRVLIFIVAFLGLLIVAGLVAVLLRIIYLSSGPAAQRANPADGGGPVAAVPSAAGHLDLPAGAVVRSVSLDGDRLAVHYEAPGGTGIAVVDLVTGAVLRRVEAVPGGVGP